MSELHTLTDQDLETFLTKNPSSIVIFSNGDNLRNEFSVALKKAITSYPKIAFARINPEQNPQATARFGIGSKPVMVALYAGDEVVRRSRPWGTDVPLAVEMLQAAQKAAPQTASPSAEAEFEDKTQITNHKEQVSIVDNTPVAVTDSTFQQEVIDYHLPVLVDFWAEWCGPCRMVAPILDKLAEEFAGQIRIAKVDVDSNPGLSQAFRIMSIPTLMMVKDKTIVFSQPGALPEPVMRDLVNQLIALEIPQDDAEANEAEEEQANPAEEPLQ